MTRLKLAVILTIGCVSGAAAQTSPSPATVGSSPLPKAAAPTPVATAPVSTPAKMPVIRQRARPARLTRKLRGDPIVSGNTDIFVDHYGQISTSLQP